MCPPPPNLASAVMGKLETMSRAKAAPPRVASLLAMDLLRLAACPPASCKVTRNFKLFRRGRWRRPNSHAPFAALAFTREKLFFRPCHEGRAHRSATTRSRSCVPHDVRCLGAQADTKAQGVQPRRLHSNKHALPRLS